jgi:hypothetical protein
MAEMNRPLYSEGGARSEVEISMCRVPLFTAEYPTHNPTEMRTGNLR